MIYVTFIRFIAVAILHFTSLLEQMFQNIENEPDSILVNVYERTTKKELVDTGKKLVIRKEKLPLIIGTNNICLLTYKGNSPFIFWLMVDGEKFNNKFYCSICNEFHSGSGSNVHSHLCTMKHKTCENPQMISPLDGFILWLLRHSIPLNSIKDELFKSFFPPSISYGQIIERIETLYNLLITEIRATLSVQQKIVLIADGWSDKRGRRYIGISARFIDSKQIKNIFLGLHDIPEVQHSANSIAQCIKNQMEFYNIDPSSVISLCTDSAPVMSATAQLLGLKWDPCFIHILNNCIKKFIEENELIYSILKKANISRKKEVFVSFLEINSAPVSNIRKYSKTRWLSCFDTMLSIVQLKDYILQYAAQYNDILFDLEEINTIELILPFISQINQAYELLVDQEDNAFSSIIFNVIQTIIGIINQYKDTFFGFSFQSLKQEIIEHFLDPNKKSCCRIIYSMILDKSNSIMPWFKESDDFQNAITYLYNELEIIQQNEEVEKIQKVSNYSTNNNSFQFDINKSFQENLWKEKSKNEEQEISKDEIFTFLEMDVIDEPFIDFWTSDEAKKQFPYLSVFATELMSHSFTSLFIERCFSHCKRILNYDRLSLTKEHASMMSMLKINIEIVLSLCSRHND